MNAARWLSVLIAVAVLSGCGGGEDSDDGGNGGDRDHAPPKVSPAPKSPSPSSSVEEAEDAVRDYYDTLNEGAFDEAWPRLSGDLQEKFGGYDTWRDGYEFTEGTTLTDVSARRSNGGAVVSVSFDSDDLDACGDHIQQSFEGTWDVESDGGEPLLVDAEVEKIAGGEPVRDEGECEELPPTPEPPPSLPPKLQDLSDAPPEELGTFCDTHECIPNFPNGRGYIVPCADGTYSHSGGIQGACSHHGGLGE